MKTGYIIAIIVITIIFSYLIIVNKKIVIKDIKHFSFSYTSGYKMNSETSYIVDFKNEKYIAKIRKEKSEIIKEMNKKQIIKLEEILNKYEVSKWDGFHKYDKRVLDGNSFSMYLTIEKKEIEASGYMKYPRNYNKVKEEIDLLFKEITN